MKYSETPDQAQHRVKAFIYHSPFGDQPSRYSLLRSQANNLAMSFNEHCPPSRELSLAHTKLEEAVMWANAAIARNEGAKDG